MRRVNYIASAGTGKTYQLVEEIYNNYILKGISIENLFISTFTEKSAGELKSRILKKLKEELSKNPEIIFDNIYKIQESYIGTIHSLCLKIIKNYPEKTNVTENTKIVEGSLMKAYLNKTFEEYLNNYINNNKEENILEFIHNKNDLYKIFNEIYNKRSRILNLELEKIESEIKKCKAQVLSLKDEVQNLLDKFINEYYKDVISLNEKDMFNTDLIRTRELIRHNRFIYISISSNKNYPRLIKVNNLSSIASDIIEKIKNNESKKIIEEEENKLIEILKKLKDNALNLNYLLVLKEFYNFNEILERFKNNNLFIDYEDILIKCFNLFKNKNNNDIKKIYQEKFKAIFIDEFQDTDNLQLELVKLLSEKSDLIIFGDPKQCIYEWRNANLDDYLEFIKKTFEIVKLNKNYRSNETLVSFYNHLFSSEKYNFLNHLDSEFTSEIISNQNNNNKETLKLIISKNEALDILRIIQNLLEENYKYGDILILFRKNNQAKELINLLKNNSIPFISYLDSSLKENLEIFSVLNFIKLIKHPFDKLNLIAVLKSPIFCYSDLDIYDIKDNLDISKINDLKKILPIIDKLESFSTYEILNYIYNEFKLIDIFSLYPDKIQKIENLNKLLKIASSFDRNNLQINDFIDFIENGKETTENIVLEDENFIKLMTIHKSKGLESKVVIIPYLLDINNIDDQGFHNIDNLMVKIKNSNKTIIAKSINFDEEIVKNKLISSEKRLLYVAFTRAKEKLILLVNEKQKQKISDKKQKQINRKNQKHLFEYKMFEFIQEIEKFITKKPVNTCVLNNKTDNNNNINYWDNIKNLHKLDENIYNQKLIIEKNREEDYKKSLENKNILSVSELMKIEKIDDFDNNNLLDEYDVYKTNSNYYSELGTFVHKVLESFSFVRDENLAKQEFLSIMNTYKNMLNKNFCNQIFEESKKILFDFINSEDYQEISNSNILFRELPFILKENDNHINGIIDLVYEKDNKIVVLDYKTNKLDDKEKIELNYEIQKEYYTKAIRSIFTNEQDKNIEFKFCWLRKIKAF